jgi:aryl-alcohol dehydrogenase-like predicted oxidoreductase
MKRGHCPNLFFFFLNRELGIAIVPYSPLGRGFFGGKAITEVISSESFLVISLI